MNERARLTVTKNTPAYWTVVIDNPPINLYDPEMLAELNVLVDTMDSDKEVKVVVFESANPDFWVAHYDFNREDVIPDQPGATDFTGWPRMVAKLAQTRAITVAKLRGRARGQGSELALACDIRFASKEKAILGQPEVAVGIVPGGGATEYHTAFAGRARALEILCGCDDFDADTAQLYGWVNRSIPDAELDAFVDNFARRVGSFLKRPLELVKRLVHAQAVYPTEAQLWNSNHAYLETKHWPVSRARIARLVELGFMVPGDMEMRMGARLAQEEDFRDLPKD